MDKFNLPSRIEKHYAFSIQKLFQELFLMAHHSNQDFLSFLSEYSSSKLFQAAAYKVSERFMAGLLHANTTAWKDKVQQSKKSREIFIALQNEMGGPIGQLVRAQINRNAFYISSTPLEISKILANKILQKQQSGIRAESMIGDLLKTANHLSYNRAKLIARTETSKASTALTRARSYNLGLDWYEWRTSEDGRVRSSHSHMSNVLIKWTDPPDPELLIGQKSQGKYHAGEIYNCRCYAAPIIDLDYLTWPRKVYSDGRITWMTRSKFESRVA